MDVFIDAMLTLHYMGSNFTDFTLPSKMVLSGCFLLKSTGNPKSRYILGCEFFDHVQKPKNTFQDIFGQYTFFIWTFI